MRCICVIPARGGSKRFPGKNTMEVGMRQALRHPASAAWRSELFPNIDGEAPIYVSTNDDEIREVALTIGPVLYRPEHLATDTATDIDVVEDIAERFSEADYLLYHYATALLTTPEQIVEGLSILRASGAYRTRCIVTWKEPEGEYLMMDFWRDAGSFNWYDLGKVRRGEELTEAFQVVPHLQAQDIDVHDDADLLRAKLGLI